MAIQTNFSTQGSTPQTPTFKAPDYSKYPSQGDIIGKLLYEVESGGQGITSANRDLTNFQTDLSDKLAAIRSQAIPLEFQQGRAQVVQQAGAEKERALQQGLANAQQQQQMRLSGLGTVAGLLPSQMDISRDERDALKMQFDFQQRAMENQMNQMKFEEDKRQFGLDYALKQANLDLQKQQENRMGAQKSGTSAGVIGGDNTSSTTLSRILEGYGSVENLTPSERLKIENEAYGMGLYSDKVPDWFKQQVESEMRMSLLPTKLKELWNEYRSPLTAKPSQSSGGSGFNFDDF